MKFIIGEPALKVEKTLVIADLHLGIEYEIFHKGIWIDQSEEIAKRINKLVKKTKAKRLLILGDLKHNVPFIKRMEKLIVPKILREVKKNVEIIITPGNHDGRLGDLIPKGIKTLDSRGILIKRILLLHGHTRPRENKASTIVIAHNHPLIRIKDKFGAKYVKKVWIIGRHKETEQKIIIMPAFSNLVGGVYINEVKNEDELLGPVARKIDLLNSECYLLDGTYIGKVKELR